MDRPLLKGTINVLNFPSFTVELSYSYTKQKTKLIVFNFFAFQFLLIK